MPETNKRTDWLTIPTCVYILLREATIFKPLEHVRTGIYLFFSSVCLSDDEADAISVS